MDSFDRAINFILNLKTEQYTSALSTVTKTTDDSMTAVNGSLGKVQVSMDAVTASTQQTSVSLQDAAKSATQTGAGMDAAAKGSSATAQAMQSLDQATKAAGADLGTVATAATNTAKATEGSSAAMKSASESADKLGTSTAAAAKATESSAASLQKASTSITAAGQSANTSSGFFQSLLGRVTNLVPGLGSLATIAGGVATGFGGLQIAEKVGNWLLDVGTKAIAGSTALKTINETVTKAQEAFQQAAGKGIETLATAITQLLGPSLEKMVGWVTEGLKWVTAFGDWFQKSGTVTSLARQLFEQLGTGFDNVGTTAQSTLGGILSSLGILGTKFDENGQEVIDWSKTWANACKAIEDAVLTLTAIILFASDQLSSQLNDANDKVQQMASKHHEWLMQFAETIGDKMPALVKKSWNALSTTLAGGAEEIRAKLSQVNQESDKGIFGQSFSDQIKKRKAELASTWETIKDGVAAQKALNDAAAKTTGALTAQAAALDNLAIVGKAGFGQALKDWQAFLELQKQVNAAVQSFIPTYETADTVMQAWGQDAVSSADQMAKAMGLVTVVTDRAVNDQISAISTGYQEQLRLSEGHLEEQIQITQAYYDKLKALLNQYGAQVDDAHKAEVQSTLQTMDELSKAHQHSLDGIVKTNKDATEQTSTLWDQCSKDIDKFMRKAASDITDDLWSGDKSFGQLTKSMLEDIGKMFTKTFIDVGLKAVQKFVTDGMSGLSGFMKSLGGLSGIFGGGSQAAGAATSTVTSAGGGAASAIGGALSAVSSVSGIVTGAISAISGVIGNFQMKGLTKVDENIQQGVFLTFYAVHDLYTEFVSYFHDFMNAWRNVAVSFYNACFNAVMGIIYRWDNSGMNQVLGYVAGIVSRIDRDIMPALRAIAGGSVSAVSGSINLQPLLDAFQSSLASLKSSLGSLSLSGLDFSPLVSVMTQVRDALTSGALRPNVTITVSTGVTTEQVSREIVYQLQMAGVIR